MRLRHGVLMLAVVVTVASCSAGTTTLDSDPPSVADSSRVAPASTAGAAPTTTSLADDTSTTTSLSTNDPGGSLGLERPEWLGTRVLPLRPDGFGQVVATPEELTDRRIATVDLLPAPSEVSFVGTVGPVPEEVVARSTWSADCPVALEDLAYLTLSFWGFDGLRHTGEMIVHGSVADQVVSVFEVLHDQRFPIEEMRVVAARELDLPPTGDGNNTTAFVCRPVTGGSGWSQHALGLAIDINPFHNPFHKGDLVLPELASSYTDRSDVRIGMILPGDGVVTAMEGIGWGWGGAWSSLTDPMHFSQNGH